MKDVFDRTEINNLALKNRLFRSATWEAAADDDGRLTGELIRIYEELAAGGVGAIITGFTCIDGQDQALAGPMRLDHDDLIADYRHLASLVKSYDCRLIAQIAMGDYRKPNSSGQSRAMEIDELDAEDIREVIETFVQGAVRAQKAGFDGVQIHAAHNFFLSRCLSPAYNHRRDDYGGSPEKRAQIVLDILQAIKKKIDGLHVAVKINCSDFFDGGLTPQESLIICQAMSDNGIDSIEVSGNGTSRPKIRPLENEAYFLEFALALKKLVSTPVILVGGLRSLEVMGKILNETPVEYLSLSRPLIREPNLPNRWQEGDSNPASCISCNGCYQTVGKRCVFHNKQK